MIERHGSVILIAGGFVLLIAGVVAADSATRIALCALSAALVVLAVVLSRTEGQLKIGPAGIEANIRAAQREAISESRALSRTLLDSGLDLATVATGAKTLNDASDPDAVRRELQSLLDRLAEIDANQHPVGDVAPPEALLEAARGLMLGRDWNSAAVYLDRYIELAPNDWDAYFARAVARANTRGGRGSDLAALRAYNDAIALAPVDLEANLLARLLSYRGAMLKRLDRLVEAKADLDAAASIATQPYERADIDYNLACVYAMTGRRDEAFEKIRALHSTDFINVIRANAERYFAQLLDDPEFQELAAWCKPRGHSGAGAPRTSGDFSWVRESSYPRRPAGLSAQALERRTCLEPTIGGNPRRSTAPNTAQALGSPAIAFLSAGFLHRTQEVADRRASSNGDARIRAYRRRYRRIMALVPSGRRSRPLPDAPRNEETPRYAGLLNEGERRDSNPRPPGPQPGALPTELRPPRTGSSVDGCPRGNCAGVGQSSSRRSTHHHGP